MLKFYKVARTDGGGEAAPVEIPEGCLPAGPVGEAASLLLPALGDRQEPRAGLRYPLHGQGPPGLRHRVLVRLPHREQSRRLVGLTVSAHRIAWWAAGCGTGASSALALSPRGARGEPGSRQPNGPELVTVRDGRADMEPPCVQPRRPLRLWPVAGRPVWSVLRPLR